MTNDNKTWGKSMLRVEVTPYTSLRKVDSHSRRLLFLPQRSKIHTIYRVFILQPCYVNPRRIPSQYLYESWIATQLLYSCGTLKIVILLCNISIPQTGTEYSQVQWSILSSLVWTLSICPSEVCKHLALNTSLVQKDRAPDSAVTC